jgi:hypothetical protein
MPLEEALAHHLLEMTELMSKPAPGTSLDR